MINDTAVDSGGDPTPQLPSLAIADAQNRDVELPAVKRREVTESLNRVFDDDDRQRAALRHALGEGRERAGVGGHLDEVVAVDFLTGDGSKESARRDRATVRRDRRDDAVEDVRRAVVFAVGSSNDIA